MNYDGGITRPGDLAHEAQPDARFHGKRIWISQNSGREDALLSLLSLINGCIRNVR